MADPPTRLDADSAADLLATTKNPSKDQFKTAMNGHLCRCGTYTAIIEAIQNAAKAMARMRNGVASIASVIREISASGQRPA